MGSPPLRTLPRISTLLVEALSRLLLVRDCGSCRENMGGQLWVYILRLVL
jgi:hypothetical protein